MATSFVDVLLQLRDELGSDTLSGGKIYTYEAGTTTPLTTYQDSLGATANTNPVILDSAGMAVIRQTDGVACKWVVYDSDDNLLWSRDNIIVGSAADATDQTYLVNMTFLGTPASQGFMGGHIFNDDVLIPIDFEGAQGSVQTSPASSYVISVRKNDVEVGTITIDTDGLYEFDTTGHATVTFDAGDKLTFQGPDTAGTAADFVVTLEGEVQ